MYKSIDLKEFHKTRNLTGKIQLLLTVKSFNLQEIRKRYLESTKRSKGGSVERRDPATGGLVYIEIENGKITSQKIIAHYKEARGIDYAKNKLLLSSENKVYVADTKTGEVKSFSNPWFSYIHTIKYNSDQSRILVASSGVDTILEIDAIDGKVLWEWNAWEAGLDKGENPGTGTSHILTKNREKAEKLKCEGVNVILIENPEKQKLPTALRAAFINSAEYDGDGNILLTFFHDGDVKRLVKPSGNLSSILQGFTKPHGGQCFGDGFLVTNTAGGSVAVKADGIQSNFNFHRLPGKDEAVGEREWLQTSHLLDSHIITVDSNRTSLVIFNPKEKTVMSVPYNPDWAVQDFVVFDDDIMVLDGISEIIN